jgi:hypothetical protein
MPCVLSPSRAASWALCLHLSKGTRTRILGERNTDDGVAKAIHLRWTLRDIKAGRTKLSPINPDDLDTLIEMGLVEMRKEVPVLTVEGERAISIENK